MLKHAGLVAGLVLVALVGSSIPALANIYGSVDCSQSPTPDCQLEARSGGHGGDQTGGRGRSGPEPSHGKSDGKGGGTGESNGGDTIVGGGAGLANCSYVSSGYQPPAGAVTVAYLRSTPFRASPARLAAVTRSTQGGALTGQLLAAPAPGKSGAWYVWKCTTAGVADGLYHPPVFIPSGQAAPDAAVLPSPAQMAELARKQLRFPTPTIAANPVGEQLVNLPTWMWLSSGWEQVSATAAVPGVSVTASATPTSVVWSMGDGGTVTCTGAGTPFRPGTAPTASSPDCGHTYRTSSASRAGQAFPVTATVHWTVTWAGDGLGGVFPDLTTAGTAAFRVAESQALNNGG